MKNWTLIILFCFSTILFGQNQDSTSNSKVKNGDLIKNENVKTKNNSMSELDYYKSLYGNTKENNESYKSLLQWTFGISLGFLLAIIGSQIFFNYRLNKKELDYIKKDIDEKVLDLENKLIKKIQEKFNDLDKSLSAGLTKNQKENKEFLEEKLNSDEELKKAQFKLLENTISYEVKSVKNRLEREVMSLKEDIVKNKGDLWKLKGVESNALSSFIEVTFIKKQRNFEIKYILDEIIDVLKELDDIHQSDYDKLKELYEEIKVSHKSKADRINELIKNKDVYTFNDYTSNWNTGIYGLLPRKITKIKKDKPKDKK